MGHPQVCKRLLPAGPLAATKTACLHCGWEMVQSWNSNACAFIMHTWPCAVPAQVSEAAVIGISDGKWGERPLLICVAKSGEVRVPIPFQSL